jgi:hypothetical protein
MTHTLHAQQRVEADRTVTPVQPQQPQTQSTSSAQIEQMVSVMATTNPAFAALAPDVQITMAAQMMNAAQVVNLQPQAQIQPHTVTAEVQSVSPTTQTTAPTMNTAATMTPIEPQPAMTAPVQPAATASVEPSIQAAPATPVAPTAPAISTLSRTEQANVDRILGLMADKPDFAPFSQTEQMAMAMSLIAQAAPFNVADKIVDVKLPPKFDGTMLSALLSVEPKVLAVPTEEARHTTIQDLHRIDPQAKQAPAISMVQGNDGQPTVALSDWHQNQHERLLGLMAQKPEFNTYSQEQQSAMALSLMADSVKFGGADKIIDLKMPTAFNGEVVSALLSVEPKALALNTQEALQTTPQDLVAAQTQQQVMEQQMAMAREQSQGRGLTL